MAGATVLRGSWLRRRQPHQGGPRLGLSMDLPIVIEIVDKPENIDRLMPFLDDTIVEGKVTMEMVRVVKYRHSKGDHSRRTCTL
jgi:PII-like signaling protein